MSILNHMLQGSSGFTPPTSNLVMHFDASIASSVHTATGVSQWDDLSGNGHNLVQATGSAQPTYSGSGTTSQIVFNGTSHQMTVSAFTLNQPLTIYIVLNQIAWTSLKGIYDGNTNISLTLFQNSSTPQVAMNGGSLGITGFNPGSLGTYRVITSVWNGASSSLSSNDGTKQTGNCGSNNPGGFTLANFKGSSAFSNIGVKEIYVYNVADGNTAQTNMVGYLRTKWGI